MKAVMEAMDWIALIVVAFVVILILSLDGVR